MFDEVSHTYTDVYGTIIPSVTQIIGAVYGTGLESAPEYFVERAAKKGTAIHNEIEMYLKTGVPGKSQEFYTWRKWYVPGGEFLSETMVCGTTPDGVRFAGTVDFAQCGWIWDWKTCKTATKKQIKKWQMQLSFYYYALKQMGYPVLEKPVEDKPLRVLHLTGDTYEIIRMEYLGDEFVENTVAMWARGEKPTVPSKELQSVSEGELQVLEEMLLEVAEADKIINAMRSKIQVEMEKRGILNLTFGKVKMSYVEASKKKTFDSTAFKKDHEDLYKQYQKETKVKPTVRITIDEK